MMKVGVVSRLQSSLAVIPYSLEDEPAASTLYPEDGGRRLF
jgi:hypothetical protein